MNRPQKSVMLLALLVSAGCGIAVSGTTRAELVKDDDRTEIELRTLKLEIPKQGLLTMRLPDTWRQKINHHSQTVTLAPDQGDEFQVLITPLWSNADDPAFNNEESIKRIIDAQLKTMLPGAVEETVEIKEFKSVDGTGYYFLVTDKAPKPGEYPYAMVSVLGIGKIILVSTVLCRSKDTIGITETIKALQSAKHSIEKVVTMTIGELTELAESGNPEAQNELGRRTGLGEGIEVDSTASAMWYEKAANQGMAMAQANLAYMYFNGEGVEKDLDKALEWNKKAAEQDNFTAQYMLGYMYITGSGVAKNGQEAEKWFLQAANRGHVRSQIALLRMYQDGDGIEKDAEKADLWLKRVMDAQTYGKVWKDEAYQDR